MRGRRRLDALRRQVIGETLERRVKRRAGRRRQSSVGPRSGKGQAEAQSQAALRTAPELTPGQLDYIRAQAELECARRPNFVLAVGDGTTAVQLAPAGGG